MLQNEKTVLYIYRLFFFKKYSQKFQSRWVQTVLQSWASQMLQKDQNSTSLCTSHMHMCNKHTFIYILTCL